MLMEIKDDSHRKKMTTGKTCFYNIANPHILTVILIILTSQCFTTLSFAEADNSALLKLISQNEDSRMGVKDLAFFLVTHDFDAVPKKDYVEVHIDDTVYRLAPNGQYPGLANETIASR